MAYNHSPRIVTDGLLLALDAANTKSYPGSGTTWTDLSQNRNNCTLTNGPTFNTSNGGSIVFDGTNDYATTPVTITTRPFTFNLWVYFNSLTGWQTFISQDTSQAIQPAAFYFQKTNSAPTGNIRASNVFGFSFTNTSNVEIFCYDPNIVQVTTWFNYCVSVSTTNVVLYKNGNQVFSITNSDTLATATGTSIIGAGYFNNGIVDYSNARLPIVNMYNRALSAAEVQQNYSAIRGRFGI